MPKRKQQADPARGLIILRQISKGEWEFEYPRIGEAALDDLDDGIDWMGEDNELAKEIFEELLRQYPEDLDAYYHLGLTYYREGQEAQAARVWKEGTELALKLFPPGFSMAKDRLQWGFLGNRPFLRLYLGYGLAWKIEGKTEEALKVYHNLLRINPSDNQGARFLAVACNFALGRPEGVLALCKRYPHDASADLLYGKPLALFLTGRPKEAAKALHPAIQYRPLVAKELLKKTHRPPPDLSEQRVIVGGRDEAYLYWKEYGVFWSKTPGAIEFLRQGLSGSS